MSTLICRSFFAILVMSLAAGTLAEEITPANSSVAATHDLPSGLSGIGFDRDLSLTHTEAQSVRGTQKIGTSLGTIVRFAIQTEQDPSAEPQFGIIGGQAVMLDVDDSGVRHNSRGHADTTLPPEKMGIIQFSADPIAGGVELVGDFTQLQIIALPGQFSLSAQ